MTAHVLRIEFDGSFYPRPAVVCNEPPEALCRAEWDCACEEYAAIGLGEDGVPWHTLTDGYMDDDQREAAEQGNPPRHWGRHGGECTYALWLNEGDDPTESGYGTAEVPITSFKWLGDGYEWTVGPTDDPAADEARRREAELRDHLARLDDPATEGVLEQLLADAPDMYRVLLREAAQIDPDAVNAALIENGVHL